MEDNCEQLKQIWDTKWTIDTSLQLNEHRKGYLQALTKYVHNLGAKTVVEEGSGSGVYSQHIKKQNPQAKVIALDYSENALGLIPPESEVERLLADVFNTPLESESVDVTFTEGLLEHYPDTWRDIVIEQLRITKRGGLIINAVPNMLNLPRTLAYYWQGKKFRYYPAAPFLPFGRLLQFYRAMNIEIIGFEGWAPLYPAKTMYEWEEGTKTKKYPLYCKFFNTTGKLIDPVVKTLNELSGNQIDRVFGWEFMIVGRKTQYHQV